VPLVPILPALVRQVPDSVKPRLAGAAAGRPSGVTIVPGRRPPTAAAWGREMRRRPCSAGRRPRLTSWPRSGSRSRGCPATPRVTAATSCTSDLVAPHRPPRRMRWRCCEP